MKDIGNYILAMLPHMLMALPFILVFRIIYNRIKGNKKYKLRHEIGVTLFMLYMTAVFSQTILTFLYTGPVVTRSFTNVNLIPLRVFRDNYYAITELNYWQPFIINFLGNICIFIPIGFMLPLIWNRFQRFWKISLIGFSISLFIETTQLTQSRSSDVDDLWLNTLGCMLGYSFYVIIKKVNCSNKS